MKNPDLCCVPGCRKEMWIFLEGRPYCAQHWHEESIRREKEADIFPENCRLEYAPRPENEIERDYEIHKKHADTNHDALVRRNQMREDFPYLSEEKKDGFCSECVLNDETLCPTEGPPEHPNPCESFKSKLSEEKKESKE